MTSDICRVLFALGFALSVSGSQAWAQPGDAGADQTDVDSDSQTEADSSEQPSDLEELERRLEILAEEVERLRSGEEESVELTDEQVRALGLAPSAARTYERGSGCLDCRIRRDALRAVLQ